jgi:hypothetical protein
LEKPVGKKIRNSEGKQFVVGIVALQKKTTKNLAALRGSFFYISDKNVGRFFPAAHNF